ncbi:MAG: hypothetical protein HEQ25_22820 [Dolichospermum sp. DET73]|nr:hypothetical protein [Dolichospermum sp. DET73]
MPQSSASVKSRFSPIWKSGKTKTIKIPIILEADLRAIARCLDQDPSIGNKIIEYAQSLIEP